MHIYIRATFDENNFSKDELFLLPYGIKEMNLDERIKFEIIDKQEILDEQGTTLPPKH